MRKISVDTGPINIFLSKEHHKETENLFNSIKTKQIQAFIATPVIPEVFKHLCLKKGKIYAESTILSLFREYPLQIVPPKRDLSLRAGELKCRFRKQLSIVDCYVIALALIRKYEVHTTEKNFPSLQTLKIVTYKY